MDEKFLELSKLADKIYNLSSVLKEYSKNHYEDINEVANIYCLVEYLHANIDTLNSIFINMD